MLSRTATVLVGLLVSLGVSVAAWYYFDTLLVFLLLPFVPFLFRGRGGRKESAGGASGASGTSGARGPPPVEECPRCGFRTRDEEYAYCPRDGTRLETQFEK